MRNGWRLDMRPPYRLMRATSGADNLLVTETEANGAALTGVELRRPVLRLMTVSRITVPGGAMPASGWNERFDHVAGVLNLPPGHRLLAAFGVDSAPESWVERWGLLDLFLLSFVTVIALRLFGWIYAAVTFAAVILVHQDNPLLVWLILLALLSIVSLRAAPAGWPQSVRADLSTFGGTSVESQWAECRPRCNFQWGHLFGPKRKRRLSFGANHHWSILFPDHK